jgi:hypothetical protein
MKHCSLFLGWCEPTTSQSAKEEQSFKAGSGRSQTRTWPYLKPPHGKGSDFTGLLGMQRLNPKPTGCAGDNANPCDSYPRQLSTLKYFEPRLSVTILSLRTRPKAVKKRENRRASANRGRSYCSGAGRAELVPRKPLIPNASRCPRSPKPTLVANTSFRDRDGVSGVAAAPAAVPEVLDERRLPHEHIRRGGVRDHVLCACESKWNRLAFAGCGSGGCGWCYGVLAVMDSCAWRQSTR